MIFFKLKRNPEKTPSEKSRNPGDRDRDFKIPKKSRENPEKIPSEKSRKSRNPGDRDLFFRDIQGISRSGGAQELKTSQHSKKHFYILKTKKR